MPIRRIGITPGDAPRSTSRRLPTSTRAFSRCARRLPMATPPRSETSSTSSRSSPFRRYSHWHWSRGARPSCRACQARRQPDRGAFDSVLALELHHDKPTSPLVNAGAMATTSFVTASDPADRWRKILDVQSAFAGAPAVHQRGDQRFRAGHQRPQQGHRLADVQHGNAFLRSDGSLHGVHPAVFDDAEHRRLGDHGRDPGRRWGQSPAPACGSCRTPMSAMCWPKW